jgi:hypothetical protein
VRLGVHPRGMRCVQGWCTSVHMERQHAFDSMFTADNQHNSNEDLRNCSRLCPAAVAILWHQPAPMKHKQRRAHAQERPGIWGPLRRDPQRHAATVLLGSHQRVGVSHACFEQALLTAEAFLPQEKRWQWLGLAAAARSAALSFRRRVGQAARRGLRVCHACSI